MGSIAKYDRKTLESIYQDHVKSGLFSMHRQRIDNSLRQLGTDSYHMLLPETHVMPLIIHPYEAIEGVVYGRYSEEQTGTRPLLGRGALVATNQRIILIDKKPLFIKTDEISYDVISGVTYARAGLAGTIVLHTRMGNISMRSLRVLGAENFVAAVDSHVFKSSDGFSEI